MPPVHDYVIDNATGANVRADINNVLQAILTNNSSSSAPSTTAAYMWWADTTNGVLKIRNSNNTDWVELLQLDGTLTLEDGSASTPGLAFRDDLNTGIFSAAADTFNVATAGVERMRVDSSGNLLHGVTANEDTTGNSGTKLITAGDLQIDGDQKALVYRSTASTAQKMSGIQWWNETAAGVHCAIFGIREAVSAGKGALGFYTSDNVDSSANNGEGDITERIRVSSAGHLLVGRTSTITIAGDPSDHNFEQLTNNGMVIACNCDQANQRGIGIFYTAGKNASDFFRCHVDTTPKVIINGSGNVQNANNSYGAISDISLKENIVDAKSQWNDIKNIKVRNYNFKQSTGQSTHTQIGVIAQELETVSPKLIETSEEDELKTVQYSVLYMKAVKALQEAQTRIETLETKVAALEAA